MPLSPEESFRGRIVGQVAIAVQLTKLIIQGQPQLAVIILIGSGLIKIGCPGIAGISIVFGKRVVQRDGRGNLLFKEVPGHIGGRIDVITGFALQENVTAKIAYVDDDGIIGRGIVFYLQIGISLVAVVAVILSIIYTG